MDGNWIETTLYPESAIPLRSTLTPYPQQRRGWGKAHPRIGENACVTAIDGRVGRLYPTHPLFLSIATFS